MPGRDPRVAERNLLFAGLGLTLGLLSRDRVIRAFTEWLLDKNRPLGDILLEQKALTPDQRAAIDARSRSLTASANPAA